MIHLIGTLAYAVRIAGVRTKCIAVSFALFNILVLVSRTSNSFQGPFLAKRIEENLVADVANTLLSDFRLILMSATLATDPMKIVQQYPADSYALTKSGILREDILLWNIVPWYVGSGTNNRPVHRDDITRAAHI